VEIQPGVYLVAPPDPASPNFRKIAQTQIVPLNYIESKDLQALLPDAYSKFVRFDQVGNRVLVCAPPRLLADAVAEIQKLDVPPVQVMIEALVVETDSDTLRNLQVTAQGAHLGLDTVNGIMSYTGGSGTGATGATGTGSSTQQAATLLSSLLWLVQHDRAQIKDNPRVVAQAGREAKVSVAVEQWFELLTGQVGYQYSTLQSVTAAVSLTITPRVSLADNQITCTIAPSIGDVTGTGADNLPIITTRSATTTVRVGDGQIIAVGGLQEQITRETRTRIPLLSDLPLVGPLFRSHNLTKSEQEVTFFLVPHILDAQGHFQGPLLLDQLQRRAVGPATPAPAEGGMK
jgi:type II secretory pathway component GspD/PulD (secretin)